MQRRPSEPYFLSRTIDEYKEMDLLNPNIERTGRSYYYKHIHNSNKKLLAKQKNAMEKFLPYENVCLRGYKDNAKNYFNTLEEPE